MVGNLGGISSLARIYLHCDSLSTISHKGTLEGNSPKVFLGIFSEKCLRHFSNTLFPGVKYHIFSQIAS
jgi:hypothetical protein